MALRTLGATLSSTLLVAFLALGRFHEGRPRSSNPALPVEIDESLALTAELSRIDQAMPGHLGVFLKRLEGGRPVRYGDERPFYLSSTIKVPVAICVLEKVDTGELSIDEGLTLSDADFIDGAGDLKLRRAGERFTIGELLGKSVRNSDSIATDMLIRRVGEDELNRRVKAWTGEGFGRITTIQKVRYDVYGPLHPGVAKLSGRDLMLLRLAPAGESRLHALADVLGVDRNQLATPSLQAAFERYYATGKNSATLEAYALLLERLVRGELLSPGSTRLLLDPMEHIQTGARRIQAGLPPGVPFAQKTGTQVGRACNMGVVNPRDAEKAVVVAACASGYGRLEEAERAFQALGRAIGASLGPSASFTPPR